MADSNSDTEKKNAVREPPSVRERIASLVQQVNYLVEKIIYETSSTQQRANERAKDELFTRIVAEAEQSRVSKETKQRPQSEEPAITTTVSLGKDFEEKSNPIVKTPDYKVPESIAPLLQEITKGDPISYSIMVNVLGSESGFKANAKSPTGVSGIAQMTNGTLYETLHRIKKLLPQKYRKIVDDNIMNERTVDDDGTVKYVARIKDGGDRDAVHTLKKEPVVALIAAREHIRSSTEDGKSRFRKAIEGKISWLTHLHEENGDPLPTERIAALEKELDRPFTAADVKTFYVCGATGGAGLLAALAEPGAKNHKAADYAPAHVVANNPNVFNDEKGRPRNIVDFYKYIEDKVGNEPLPENLTRPEHLDVSLNNYLQAQNSFFNLF